MPKGRKRAAAAADDDKFVADGDGANNGKAKATGSKDNGAAGGSKKANSAAGPGKKAATAKKTNGAGGKKAVQKLLKVDAECPKAGTCGIYLNPEDGTSYACVLNQTNIAQNNNKFFIIQVIKEIKANKFYAWIRWGRVGYTGQTALTDCGKDVEKAIGIFEKKFLDKTKNRWSERSNFQQAPGKYDLVKTEVGADDDEPEEVDDASGGEEDQIDGPKKKVAKKAEVVPSKLEKAVQDLIKLICDIKTMELEAADLEFDTKRNPLGKVTVDQIKAGYESLSKIAELLSGQQRSGAAGGRGSGGGSGSVSNKLIRDLSSEFYTRIPHYFGFRVPPPIVTLEKVKAKIKLLEVLGDIKLGLDLMKSLGDLEDEEVINPVDRYYRNLRCDLSALAHDDEDFSMVEQYIQSTHAQTHNQYDMDVLEVYKCQKEAPGFKEELGNRRLLFHGSRMSNWAGILSQGLRIAPPEAPVTGYMFGKGVYFADMASKSANYCYASKVNPYGLLLLCEVALGSAHELHHADYDAAKLPKGKHSVKGVGENAPVDANAVTMDDGTVVPMGPASKVGERRSLLYNEYIVYNVNQVRLRYITKIKFDYK